MTTPSESSDRWDRLWEVFHAALEREPSERDAFLDGACAADAALRREVDELLAAHFTEAVLDTPLAPEQPSAPAFAAGDLIASRFRVVREIGAGGMGTVYEATDEELGTSVALKTLHPDLARNHNAVDRFRREVALARRVTHPHACRLFDLFHHHDGATTVTFVTMELLRGETLAERITRTGPLSEAEALPIVEQMASALAAAHRAGIVHRDLKSANVMLVTAGEGEPTARAVVTDFGLAALVDAMGGARDGLTRSGQLLGTPAYMAPEQLEGQTVTPAADIYTLGLVMYEILTGSVPFAGESPLRLALKRLRHQPPPPRTLRADVGAEWNAVIMRCLQRDPADRFATAEAVIDALQTQSSAAHVFVPRRIRRLALVSLAATAALVLIGAFVASRIDLARPAAAIALAFNERDWVLVGEFDNRTGETLLDDTVRFALVRELNTSQFVNVVPRERVADALRLMKRAEDTPLVSDVAREVSLRDGGIRAFIRGRIEKLGSDYVTAVELVEPAGGVVIASFAQPARGQENILAAVREISNQLRTAVGEQRLQGDRANQKLLPVTTPSLRALQLYSRADGVITHAKADAAAEELLEQAIEEDPTFASAYIHLAHAIVNQGRREEALRYAARAMELAATVDAGEAHFIRGGYYSMAGDYQRALGSYQALLQLYPDHFWATNNAAMMLSFGLLNGAEAVPHFTRAAELRPNDFIANRNIAWNIAVRGNNLAAARQPIARAQALLTPELAKVHGSAAAWVEVFPAIDRWIEGDAHGAARQLEALERRLATHPAPASLSYQMMFAYQSLGRLRQAQGVVKPPEFSSVGLVFAYLRNDTDALNRWKALRVLPPSASGRLGALGPIILARLGLPQLAKTQMPKGRSDRTTASIAFEAAFAGAMPIVRGEVALAEGNTAEAITLIEHGLPAERLTGSAVYFLGCEALAAAWLKQNDVNAAIAALEDAYRQRPRSIQGSGIFWVRAAWELAKVYRRAGRPQDAAAVEATLRQALVLADADYPVLVEMNRSAAAAATR